MADYATTAELKADVPDSPLFDPADESYDVVLGKINKKTPL